MLQEWNDLWGDFEIKIENLKDTQEIDDCAASNIFNEINQFVDKFSQLADDTKLLHREIAEESKKDNPDFSAIRLKIIDIQNYPFRIKLF